MANHIVDPGSTPGDTGTKLQVVDGGSTLVEVDLEVPYTGGYRRNYEVAQALGSSEGVLWGDGRQMVRPRTIGVIVQAESAAALAEALYDLEQALQQATHLAYGGVSLELVGVPSFQNVRYLGDRAARVTIEYLPRYAQGLVGAQPVFGPI